MSEKFRLDHKIGFQNMFYIKYVTVIIDSIGPLIILRSILLFAKKQRNNTMCFTEITVYCFFKARPI